MPNQLLDNLALDYSLPLRFDGYVVLAIYALVVLAIFFLALRTFRGLGVARWVLLAFLLALSAASNGVLLVPASAFVPASILPQVDTLPPVPLLGLVCALLAGAWLGVGPALVVGLIGGAARWLLAGGRFTQPAEMALLAAVAAFFVQQDYRGWLARTLRRPLVAGIAAGFVSLLGLPFAVFAASPGSSLAAVDYTLSVAGLMALALIGECALGGLSVQLACLAFPAMRRSLPGAGIPPYARSLGRRLLFTILPITFLTITAQVIFVGLTAMDAANRQTIAQLSRNAQATAELLDAFFVDGQALLERFATDDRLQSADLSVQQAQLDAARSTVAFFDQMLLVDARKQVIAATRGTDASSGAALPGLTADEEKRLERVLGQGAPQRTDVHDDADGNAMISFLQPIGSGVPSQGALIGRTRLLANPRIGVMKRGLANTQNLGVGYLVDDKSRIVVHPDPSQELRQWVFDPNQPPMAVTDSGGKAYIDLYPDNTRRFIFVQDVPGSTWTVAIELPYSNILDIAAQISAPLVLMFVVIMIGALVLLPYISRRVAQPIGALAQAAREIAKGELARPVSEMGEDEVGQLGAAFESMRQSLKARMDELSLLLRVSQSVAASLDLDRGVPPILDAAMQVTSPQAESGAARTARVVVLDDEGRPLRVVACGDGPVGITPLDTALMAMAVRDERPLFIENVARSRGAVDPNLVGPGVKAIIALPLRRSNRALGILWLGYPAPRRFSEPEVSLLVTLSGQAAVFLENVGLFEAAEGGRRRLQAVLTSTNDAVLVTDRDNRILLCNPAAEIAFSIAPGQAVGRPSEEVIADRMVVDLLTERGDPAVRTAEIMLPDGRTLYGSASSIVASDGARIGRVVVLRDITHFKELDSLKSEFVNTVSHDLRSPLTYMRGYVTMVPMIGSVAAKQQDYLDKIMGGIEQMTALIDDLLDLGRIEAGVGIVPEPLVLADVAREAMESMQSAALAHKTTLEFDAHSSQVTLKGDRQLIKHAVANLVDNAIKYTQAGGWVRVGVDERDGYLVIRVTDNGIGIALSDQVRLFEKFYRVKRRDTLDIKGTGLGLAIVKSIAEWHHGRVWVESQTGQGSTFYIALPIES